MKKDQEKLEQEYKTAKDDHALSET